MIIWHQSNSTQSKSALDGVSILCFHYTILVKKRSIQAVLPVAVGFTTIYSHTDALLGMTINDREKHCCILNRGQTVKHTSTTTVTLNSNYSLSVLFSFGLLSRQRVLSPLLVSQVSVRLLFVPCWSRGLPRHLWVQYQVSRLNFLFLHKQDSPLLIPLNFIVKWYP